MNTKRLAYVSKEDYPDEAGASIVLLEDGQIQVLASLLAHDNPSRRARIDRTTLIQVTAATSHDACAEATLLADHQLLRDAIAEALDATGPL